MTHYLMSSGWVRMKLLLDSHTFIWWDNDLDKLSPRVLTLCQDRRNILLISVGSIWEIQIKVQLGKLQLPLSLQNMIKGQQQVNKVRVLPVKLEHVLALDTLPMHHRDPFDRLLIAQANVEDAVLLSHDHVFTLYPVNVQW